MADSLPEIIEILGRVLQIDKSRTSAFAASTQLLGSLPELDSMAVVAIITALEEYFGFTVDDDEINAEVFATVGTLGEFVDAKNSA